MDLYFKNKTAYASSWNSGSEPGLSYFHVASFVLLWCFLVFYILDNFRKERSCTVSKCIFKDEAVKWESSSQIRGKCVELARKVGSTAVLFHGFSTLAELGIQYIPFGNAGLVLVILIWGTIRIAGLSECVYGIFVAD